ncbi:tyrosine-type recombinase/integrase [Dongia sp.]|uniref:tyrosine-type recombinase/integrase n=1 Tax=Dongia sp. TaxID=1977262 RepID=UPI0035B0B8D7
MQILLLLIGDPAKIRAMPRIRLHASGVPSSLTGWALIDDFGRPRYWATIWADVLNANVSHSTRGANLTAVEKLYRSAKEQLGYDGLDRVLHAGDIEALESILGGFLTMLRNESAIDAVDRDTAWRAALSFVEDVLAHFQPTTGHQAAQAAANLLRLQQLYRQLAPTPPKPPAPIRALPAVVIEDLYEIFSPESERNPFRSPPGRWRNFLLYLLLLHLGLRRGESLILPADAIKDDYDPATGEVRYWISIVGTPYEDDPRQSVPRIKTAASYRHLPISAALLNLTNTYVQNYRKRCPHAFMLNSQMDKPLSAQSVNHIFGVATECLSERARKALSDRGKLTVTPHDLRHTAAVIRLAKYVESGLELDHAIEKLRVFFGWSPTSQMPRHYARAYFETNLAEVWEERFDDYVDAMRDATEVVLG